MTFVLMLKLHKSTYIFWFAKVDKSILLHQIILFRHQQLRILGLPMWIDLLYLHSPHMQILSCCYRWRPIKSFYYSYIYLEYYISITFYEILATLISLFYTSPLLYHSYKFSYKYLLAIPSPFLHYSYITQLLDVQSKGITSQRSYSLY